MAHAWERWLSAGSSCAAAREAGRMPPQAAHGDHKETDAS